MDSFLMDYKKRDDHEAKTKELFYISFQLLQIAETGGKRNYEKIVEKNPEQINLAKRLIDLYYSGDVVNYESMLYNFKRKYINNEAKVEYNDEDKQLEYKGIGYMYDYIQDYKTNENDLNIFIEGLKLHKLLYKAFDDKTKDDREATRAQYVQELDEAKKNKDLKEYKRVSTLLKSFTDTNTSFGGTLRTDDVDLQGVEYHVPTAREASEFFNSFVNIEKRVEYSNILASSNIFGYIEYCVKTCVDIIKYQPFNNGNKRTARALLNLLFKNKNIPPVYITRYERKPYKDALLKAIVDNDYEDIINFYYFKICDSIYELDIVPYITNRNKEEKTYTIAGSKPRINEVYLREHGAESIDDEPDDSDVKIYSIGTKK